MPSQKTAEWISTVNGPALEGEAVANEPDGDRITVTLSIDVDVDIRVLADGIFFFGYAVGDFDFADEALFCANRNADLGDSEEEGWHANLNLSYKSGFGYGPYADSLKDVVVESVREALLFQLVPRHDIVPPNAPAEIVPAEVPWDDG